MALDAGYQHGDAFDNGDLPVSGIHTVHYEQYGKPDGKPGKYLPGRPHLPIWLWQHH